MVNRYKEQMDYVEKILKEAGRDEGRRHPFRSRSCHTKRVCKWAERLCEGRNDINEDVLYNAVIFHDVGYVAESLEGHEKVSEMMFREYAEAHHYKKELTERVSACISIHSEKERLVEPKTLNIEQIILMEADLLDEEGALAVCWDGMACGYEGKHSYEDSLERSIRELTPKKEKNPMVTELGKFYWNDKMKFVSEYITRLTFDLEM